jgi:alkylated DNA repair dioxygenase AlkB
LTNYYEVEHDISKHSDDEGQLVNGAPIFSLSWGGRRRFRLHRKKPEGGQKEFVEMEFVLGTVPNPTQSDGIRPWYSTQSHTIHAFSTTRTRTHSGDGDLLIMGGALQKTHKHDVPPHRKKDPPSGRRINFTARSFVAQHEGEHCKNIVTTV